MKIKFHHKIYDQIILDTAQLKPVNNLIPNELHKKHWYEMYLGDTVFFGHSACMWQDDFIQEYNDPTFIDLSNETIQHEINKLKAKYGETYDTLRKTNIVETDLYFVDWYKENLAYKNKR